MGTSECNSTILIALSVTYIALLVAITITSKSVGTEEFTGLSHLPGDVQDGLTAVDGAYDRCPKCRWVCQPRVCPQTCRPLCQPPTCRIKCKPLGPARCKTRCKPPRCRVVCAPGDRCVSGRCPGCVVKCDPPECSVECCKPRAQCITRCDPPDCTWSCSKPRDCPAPHCYMKCDGDIDKKEQRARFTHNAD